MTDHELDQLIETLPPFNESQVEYRAGKPYFLHSTQCQGDCECQCSEQGLEHAKLLRTIRRCG